VQYWSWLLTAVGVFGLWLAGRGKWYGWAVNLGGQALWTAYALVSHQYGFLLSAAAYGWVFARNLLAWREKDAKEREKGVLAHGA